MCRKLIAIRIVLLARKEGADKLGTVMEELWRYKLVQATRKLQLLKETDGLNDSSVEVRLADRIDGT